MYVGIKELTNGLRVQADIPPEFAKKASEDGFAIYDSNGNLVEQEEIDNAKPIIVKAKES